MKNFFCLNIFFAFLVTTISLTVDPAFANQDPSEKIDKYIKIIESSSLKQRIDAAKFITRSGWSDPRLFNVINEKLLNGYNLYPGNSEHVDEMAWMCKALASAGSSEYKPTLEQIIQTASSSKLKRYAEQSLNMVDEYAEKNRIMKDNSNFDSSLSPEINQYINMLKSNNLGLKKDAAKLIYRGNYTQEKLFDVVNEELLRGYKNTSSGDRNAADTMAWLCKALGSSGNQKYKDTLVQVMDGTSSSTLKGYAKKSLKMLK